ncbi:MAG: NAD-dependent epimerase/dehydratase family protein, partial [Akkermansiaceae bacterium]|nr:NAD-dependent epimerase/dehydratase family protein [Akkermansiaceae bacterium]
AGHGYLGAEAGRQARARGWEVAALSKSGDGESMACDLSDRGEVQALGGRVPPPGAILLSASSGRGGAAAYRAVFIDGSRHLREVFPEAHLVFVSSTSVYGQTGGETVDEDSPTEPDRETSRLLLEAEAQVLAGGGTVARLAGIYGPGRSVILKKFLAGEARIEDDGRRFLNQIHRDDAARALLHLASHPGWSRGEIYNVADCTPLHQGDCYRALADLFGRDLPPSGPRDTGRKRAWTHKQVSNAKLRATGWDPEFPSFLDAAETVAETLGT